MAEATYFNEPDLKVTSSKIMTPEGVFQAKDLQSVEFSVGSGFWVSWGLRLAFAVLAFYVIPNADLISGVASGTLRVISLLGFLASIWLLKETYIVKVRGAFGLVEFDCGTNESYARKLAGGLRRLLNAGKNQSENIPGAA